MQNMWEDTLLLDDVIVLGSSLLSSETGLKRTSLVKATVGYLWVSMVSLAFFPIYRCSLSLSLLFIVFTHETSCEKLYDAPTS